MEALKQAAHHLVDIDDSRLPLVTFRFKPCEPSDALFKAYLDCFEHIMKHVATHDAPVVITFDLRNGTARNPLLLVKQAKFNEKMRPVFVTNLGATAVLVDSDFYRGCIQTVFRMVGRTRPSKAFRLEKEAHAFLKKEYDLFLEAKAKTVSKKTQ